MDKNGVLTDAKSEFNSFTKEQIDLIKNLIVAGTDPPMIALSMGSSEQVINYIKQQYENEETWTTEKIKELKRFLLNQIDVDSI